MQTTILRGATRIALLAAALSIPAGANAQTGLDPSNTRGLFVGARTVGHGVAYEGDRDGGGGGVGLRLGYGFSDLFTGYVGIDGATISEGDGFERLPEGDSYGLVYIDLGGRFHFRRDHRWVPFLEASGSIVGLAFDTSEDQEDQYGGAAFTAGAGLLYFATPNLALEGAASMTAGSLMERELAGTAEDIDIGVAGVRLHLGVAYYPFD